jgi:hypothetical protein
VVEQRRGNGAPLADHGGMRNIVFTLAVGVSRLFKIYC